MKLRKINTKFDIVISSQADAFLRDLAQSSYTAATTRKAAAQYVINMFCAGKFKELKTFYEGGAVPLEQIGQVKK